MTCDIYNDGVENDEQEKMRIQGSRIFHSSRYLFVLNTLRQEYCSTEAITSIGSPAVEAGYISVASVY